MDQQQTALFWWGEHIPATHLAQLAVSVRPYAPAEIESVTDLVSYPGQTVELATLIEYAVVTYGRERLPALMTGLGQYQSWETLIPAVYGVSVAEIEESLMVLVDLQQQGLIRHLGVSNVTPQQVAQAQAITPIVCVQNYYNVTQRADEPLIDDLARQQIAYTPFFPLGGFTPLQSAGLTAVAQALGAPPMQVALAWLLQRSPNLLLIPGTSSVTHLHENMKMGAKS